MIIKSPTAIPTRPTSLFSVQMAMLDSLLFFLVAILASAAAAPLKVGHYQHTCPSAEAIVRRTVRKAIARNHGLGAGLIRMHFHDCFVRGCDGSVLLDSTPGNLAERDHPANNPSLRGYEVIHAAKAKIEARCPHTVSCADIIAFAARDSAHTLGAIRYAVPAGRRDGRISISDEAGQNLPPPTFDAQQLKNRFEAKGLSLDDMVTLSGAHSIGVSHCSSFTSRLYNSSQNSPSIDQKFAARLKSKCPPTVGGGDNEDPTVPLDKHSPSRLDNHFYVNLKKRKGVLASDQTLFDSSLTSGIVRRNAAHQLEWAAKFAAAMVRMGYIDVMTGNQGEIRKDCRVVNGL